MKYSKKQLDTFFSFKYVGNIKSADISAKVVSKECGDVFKIYANIEDGKIIEAKFKAFGSVTIFNVMTYVVDLILDKKVEDLAKITRQDIIACFDEISSGKQTIIDNALLLINKVHTQGLKAMKNPKIRKKLEVAKSKICPATQNQAEIKEQKSTTKLTTEILNVSAKESLATNSDKLNLDKSKIKPLETQLTNQSLELPIQNPTRKRTALKKTSKQKADATTEISFEDAIKKINKNKGVKKTKTKKNLLLDDDNFDMVDEIDTITARLSEAVSKLKNKTND